MATVTVEMIKRLRMESGAGISDCKKALEEANGDIEKAKKILMARGLAKAAKKASRATKEGIVKIVNNGKKAIMFDLQCETDFVARNEKFQELADILAEVIFEAFPANKDEALRLKKGEMTLEELIKHYISVIGENIVLGNLYRIEASDNSKLFDYVHFTKKIGVILELKAEPKELFDNPKFNELAKNLVLQIAAMRPKYLREEDVPEDWKKEQVEVFKEEAIKEGKPEHIAERIAMGRLNKLYKDVVLLKQEFFKDPNLTIAQLIQNTAKELDGNIEAVRFIRVEI